MLPIAPHKGRQVTDARRQQSFDSLSQPPGQYRRRTIGADCDHDFASIDDGRNDEVRQVWPVDHVDEDAGRAGMPRYRFVARVAVRDDNGDKL